MASLQRETDLRWIQEEEEAPHAEEEEVTTTEETDMMEKAEVENKDDKGDDVDPEAVFKDDGSIGTTSTGSEKEEEPQVAPVSKWCKYLDPRWWFGPTPP